MAKATLAKTSYAWKQIAEQWQAYFTSPSRPSFEEVNQYREWLKKIAPGKRGLKGLVLGATPELRDALNEFKLKPYLIDINLEMILAMTDLLKRKNPDEVIIKANWLDNPLADQHFDVILGDAILPNIPWDKRLFFLSEIKRLLKPRGYFVTRAFCVPDKKPFKTIHGLLNHFAQKKSSKRAAIEMVLEIQILTYDPKDHLGSMAKVKRVVEKLRGRTGFNFKSRNLNKTLDIVWNYWLKGVANKVWLYAHRNQEEKEYKKYFKILETFEAGDHPYGSITPMYLLTTKL